jgi:arabinogalactan oligomer/maltooligosaccharide transport system substrate-binding protein
MCLQVGAAGDAYHIYPSSPRPAARCSARPSSGDPDPKTVNVGSSDSVAAFAKLKELGEKGLGALKTSIGS